MEVRSTEMRTPLNRSCPYLKKKFVFLKNFFKNPTMDEDYTIYREDNLFAESLATLREIRRQGRLCDVVLKVSFRIIE
jgi:hypothetical protein